MFRLKYFITLYKELICITVTSNLKYIIKQDAYHRRKHESRIRTSTALIARDFNMHELNRTHNISLDLKCGFLMHLAHGTSHKQLIFLLEWKILRCYPT